MKESTADERIGILRNLDPKLTRHEAAALLGISIDITGKVLRDIKDSIADKIMDEIRQQE